MKRLRSTRFYSSVMISLAGLTLLSGFPTTVHSQSLFQLRDQWDANHPQSDPALSEFMIQPDSGLEDFSLEQQAAIVSQYWRFKRGENFSPSFKNSADYEAWEQEDLIRLFEGIVHSVITLKDRALDTDRTFNAKRTIEIRRVTIEPSARLELTAGQKIVISPNTTMKAGSEVVLKAVRR